MNRKNKQQTKQIQTSSSTNIHDIDIDEWVRQVKNQMMAALKKRSPESETK